MTTYECMLKQKGMVRQHGGEWLKMKGKQLGGSHGRMSEPLQQTIVVGKRMSKPYVPYGIKRFR